MSRVDTGMLERSRVLSYIFGAIALLAVMVALRPHHQAPEQAGWVRVDVVPSYGSYGGGGR